MKRIFYDNPIVEEISEEYSTLRSAGVSRSDSIDELKHRYCYELNDADDGAYVRVALAIAQCMLHELTADIAEEALNALKELENAQFCEKKQISLARELILEKKSYGDEKKIKLRKRFSPGWEIGDTFIHLMESNCAESCGLKGWGIIVRKVGDYIDHKNREIQLVVMSICPPELLDNIPDHINSLDFVQMMKFGKEKTDYLAQLCITKKNNEAAYEISKIGNFPVAKLPEDQYNQDLRVARPLSCLKNSDGCIHYEEVVCMAFKNKGKGSISAKAE